MATLKNIRGFTLIELMVTVAVLAIILSIAIPSFSGILLSNRISTTANELRTTMQVARSEAVKRKKPVVVCRASADFEKCETGKSDWSVGWLMMSGNNVLKVWESGRTLVVQGPISTIEFAGDGSLSTAYSLKVNAQDCSNGIQYELKMSRSGNIKLRKGSC